MVSSFFVLEKKNAATYIPVRESLRSFVRTPVGRVSNRRTAESELLCLVILTDTAEPSKKITEICTPHSSVEAFPQTLTNITTIDPCFQPEIYKVFSNQCPPNQSSYPPSCSKIKLAELGSSKLNWAIF